ncbi:MAG TPA: hypothetical protein VFD84_07405 [Candidatus Binatia bacterium]|nr:hypothetical protein [Candidatus Binatia bacterium]
MDLSKLNFGAPAAERDISVGLADYFVESDAYARLASRKKTIVLGNRGTGKSAIFKILAGRARSSGSLVLELSPEDYSYEMLSSVLRSEREGAWAKHGAFASSWKFLILVLVMKELTRQGPRFKTGAAARIYEYLRDHHEGAQDTPISVLVSYLKRIEGLKVGTYEASIKTRELSKLYKLQEIEPLLPCIQEIVQRRPVTVLVDELDKGWDNSEDAKAFVSGLFQASISLNDVSPRLTVYVSLRQELYDSIPALYDDTQKYRDLIEIIRWDEPSLLAVAAKRIRHSLPELAAEGDTACWNGVFAETLQYRKTKSFNYMIDRTLYRPRELIQFCTDAVEDARTAKADLIDYQVISRAELGYSSAREKDIASEYRFQYPGLSSVFEVFRGRVYTLERDELENICLSVCTGEIRTNQGAEWVLNQDADFLVDVLWRVGFLRAYAVGGLKALRRSGSSYVGPHQVATLNLRTISRFQVHPMFRAVLGMKEPKKDSTRSLEDDE